MKSSPFTRRVNLSRLRPVADPHRKPASPDPDESGPPCPHCGDAETFWCIDPRTGQAVLVCSACIDAEGGA